MWVLSELWLGTRDADTKYVQDFVKETHFSQELRKFLENKWVINYFWEQRIDAIFDDIQSDVVIQAIVAWSKLSMAVCEGHWWSSLRAKEVQWWVPDVSDEVHDWCWFHDDKMIEVISHILNNK